MRARARARSHPATSTRSPLSDALPGSLRDALPGAPLDGPHKLLSRQLITHQLLSRQLFSLQLLSRQLLSHLLLSGHLVVVVHGWSSPEGS